MYTLYATVFFRTDILMSYTHVHLIPKVEGLTASQSAVLTWLAIHANKEGYAWPGVPQLARETRHSQRYTKTLLNQLQALRHITKSKGTYATHYRTAYFMAYAENRSAPPVEPPPPPPPPNGRPPGQRRNDLVGLFQKDPKKEGQYGSTGNPRRPLR